MYGFLFSLPIATLVLGKAFLIACQSIAQFLEKHLDKLQNSLRAADECGLAEVLPSLSVSLAVAVAESVPEPVAVAHVSPEARGSSNNSPNTNRRR